MMRWLWHGLGPLGAVLVFSYLTWTSWTVVRAPEPTVSLPRREVADDVIPTIVEDIREHREASGTTAFFPLAGDPSNYLSDNIQNQLAANGILQFAGPTTLEQIGQHLAITAPQVGDAQTALRRAKSRSAGLAIYGNVLDFESAPDSARLDVEIHLLDVASGRDIFSHRYQQTNPTGIVNSALAGEPVHGAPYIQRFLAWALIVLLLPIFSIRFMQAAIRKNSNRANAWVLGIYTIIAVVAAGLLGARVSSAGSLIALAMAGAAAFFYNAWIMARLARAEAAI